MTVAKKLEGCNSLRPCRWSRQARPSRVGQRSRQARPSRVGQRSRQARPSRVGQRSQRTATLPRHVAMAPSPSYLPASCRDGEGAPLLRPLARLTSFGGYVATAHYQLPTIIYISTLLHGHFHDGEGAVATGQTSLRGQTYHLPTNLNAIENRKFHTRHRLAENGQV